ncbi:inositol monophosphatase 3-like [Oscarella lobularis]|uniref:inositol monophosphatase 3-like n=1 Tax=Oscarella lobularis TaxID=121494 RepID=UPI0033138634
MFRSNVKPSPIGVAIIVFVLIGVVYLYFRGPAHEASHPRGTILLSQLLSAAIDLAERGGRVVADVRRGDDGVNERVKGMTAEGKAELVTRGDMLSHRAIVKGLLKAFPDVTYVSEEHETEREFDVEDPNLLRPEIVAIAKKSYNSVPISKVSVWIDPLDATQEYQENLLQYVTVMICIAIGDHPVAAVIREPDFGSTGDSSLPGKTTWVWIGHGMSEGMADLIKETKETIKKKSDDKMTFIVSRSHAGPVKDATAKAYGEKKTVIVPAGGSGHKVLQVIRGKADAYVHVTCIKKWDICAGDAILRAAGGKMTTLTGKSIKYSPSTGPYNDGGILAALVNQDSIKNEFKTLVEKEDFEVKPCNRET